MKALAFDTLEFAKRLRAVDFTEKQAETLATMVAEIIESRLATKEDIAQLQHNLEEKYAWLQRDMKELEARLKHDLEEKYAWLQRDMKELEVRLKHDLEEKYAWLQRDMKELQMHLKHDLTLRLGGMLAAGVAIVAALVKLL